MVVFAALLTLFSHSAVGPTAPQSPRLGHTHFIDTPEVLSIAAQPGGHRFVATFMDSSVRIYDAATLKKIKVFRGHPFPPHACAWSRDGKFIATGDESARVFVWNLATGKRVAAFRVHTKGIENLSFNQDGSMLVSTGQDDVMKIYDLKKNRVLRTIDSNGAGIYGGEFAPRVNIIAVATLSESARIYSPTGTIIYTMNSNSGGAFDCDYNAAGTMLITAGKDGNLVLWDPKDAKRLGTLRGHEDQVLHAALAPSGRVAASSSDDRSVRVWDTKTLKQIGILEQQDAQGSPVRFTGDGKYLLSADIGNRLEVTPIVPPQPAPEPPKTVRKKTRYVRRRRR
ncbi:MAG: WD40 repeat domain-containing protein [Fimbriimonadaceae bacterium]